MKIMGLLDSIKGMFGKGSNVADVNNDGQVNAADLGAAAQAASSTVSQAADVNNDGQVNVADAQAAATDIQGTVAKTADVNNDGQVNAADATAAVQGATDAAGQAVNSVQDQLPK